MVTWNPLRWGEGRKARKIWKIADQVNHLADEVAAMGDDELQARTAEFRQRLADGEALDDLLVEVFATIREVAWRVVGERPYDVQVFGGVALHQGNIAEMKTGEGKTLTSTMPVYLNALEGFGVHVVTVNEYLAKRDAEWMGAVHEFMGLTVGVVHSNQSKADKRAAYDADITYGTTNEFGFDYLRDNMTWDLDSQVQRGHNFALLDEVDSILIDEARTPLIISGQPTQSAQWYQVFAKRVVPHLKRGQDLGEGETTGDYVVDEAKRTVAVTEEGVAKVEDILDIDNLFESVNTPLIHHLNNAVKARELFKRDREYIVVDGEVRIVDEQTGRVLEGRRYSEGLHQAIEAKEGVRVKEENQTLATITLQNYYRQYHKLAGMTGTAKTEEVEFLEIYELGVVEVDTNEPVIRDDRSDLIYKTERVKFEAVVDDIAERHVEGQPVLVGTTSVEKSELLSGMLRKRGVDHNVLNAKQHAREAHVVAQAGRPGNVTVATNMAGRGTDILLGGNPEELARADVGLPLGGNPVDEAIDWVVNRGEEELSDQEAEQRRAQLRADYDRAIEQRRSETGDARQAVLDAGGLYVIGTERHDSRRIDNQLRGRSGRQGDPGASRFYLSLGDDLMRLFNASAVESIMTRLNVPDDVPIEAKMVTKAVGNAQRQVESRNFDIRKNVLKYDDVLNDQRKVVYGARQDLVEGDDEAIEALADEYLHGVVSDLVATFAPEGVFPEEWDLASLWTRLRQVYDPELQPEELDIETIDQERLVARLSDDIQRAYDERVEEVGGPEVMRQVERRVILNVVDRKWRQHLYEMDALRDGIGLRAVGQRDPLTEYQREAYHSFTAMMASVKEEAVTYFFHLPVQTTQDRQAEAATADEHTTDGRVAAGISLGGPRLGDMDDIDAAATSSNGDGADEAARVTTSDGAGAAADDGAGGDGGDDDEGVTVVFEDAPDEPQDVTYTSAETTDSSVSAMGTADGGPVRSGGADVTKRDDGTTVRRVATGTTYTTADDEYANVGRNDPCPCGSGKKFKKCHG